MNRHAQGLFGRGRIRLLVLLPAALAAAGCAATADPAVRYIAFGDSTTAGPADTQYWEFLRDDLGQPADSFAGAGQGGESTTEGLDRLRGILDDGLYPNAMVLLYWEGGNDLIAFVHDHDPLLALSPSAADYPFAAELATSLDSTQANIEEAIWLGRGAGLAVYAATYFHLNAAAGQCKPALLGVLLPAQEARVTEYIQLLNDRIRIAAANAGAVLVDVAQQADAIAADPANYVNCDHLSDRGNQLVAGIFRAAIQAQP